MTPYPQLSLGCTEMFVGLLVLMFSKPLSLFEYPKVQGQQFLNAIAFPRLSCFSDSSANVAAGFISTSKRVSGSRSVVPIHPGCKSMAFVRKYGTNHITSSYFIYSISFNFLPFQSLTPFSKSRYRQWKPGKRWIKVIKV